MVVEPAHTSTFETKTNGLDADPDQAASWYRWLRKPAAFWLRPQVAAVFAAGRRQLAGDSHRFAPRFYSGTLSDLRISSNAK